MRLLLDEHFDEGLVLVLQGLGHQATHVGLSDELRGSSDPRLAEVAATYDVFVTMDLHRQLPEWLAVNRALMGATNILRIRLSSTASDKKLEVVKTLVYRMEEWMHAFEAGYCLVTIGQLGTRLARMTREDVASLLAARATPSAGGETG